MPSARNNGRRGRKKTLHPFSTVEAHRYRDSQVQVRLRCLFDLPKWGRDGTCKFVKMARIKAPQSACM